MGWRPERPIAKVDVRLKILQVINVFHPAQMFGGPQRVVYDLSKELARRGHEVTVYTTNALDRTRNFGFARSEYEFDGFKVRYFKNILRPDKLYISPGIVSVVRNIRRFDLIHIHSWRNLQDMVVSMFAREFKIPYILQVHGGLPRSTGKCTLKLIYDMLFGYQELNAASRVIALSRIEAQQYRDMGVPEGKIEVIPNGIDLSGYANLPHKGSFKKKFKIHNDKKIILYLGRINNTKGIDFLFKAYAYLIKNMKYNIVILVIAGPDDGYLSQAKELASSLGISSSVLFLGFLTKEEKISAYVDSSLVVSPERFNVFLLVPLEAAACGKPVIVSTTNHISHMIREGDFGFSVKYDDIDELAEAMGKIFSNNDLATQMGQKGRRFVFGNCDWTYVVSKLEKLYEEIVK